MIDEAKLFYLEKGKVENEGELTKNGSELTNQNSELIKKAIKVSWGKQDKWGLY